ncbi:hypothetical protein DFH08DRAFT_827016 [Mycena albidolilacea]|uniref:Uncharacterized protein n=1 Tax=Mycena albidolilacea TaxID=1033008 RepID=A0AAD6YZC3_9AGAR|nr:hypothetical protein DFH08DRAFT_827016 [Mycena albidolilacea]
MRKRRVLRRWHDERERTEEKKDRKHKGGKLTKFDASSASAAARILLPASSLCVSRSRVWRRANLFEERQAGKQTVEQRKDVKLTPGNININIDTGLSSNDNGGFECVGSAKELIVETPEKEGRKFSGQSRHIDEVEVKRRALWRCPEATGTFAPFSPCLPCAFHHHVVRLKVYGGLESPSSASQSCSWSSKGSGRPADFYNPKRETCEIPATFSTTKIAATITLEQINLSQNQQRVQQGWCFVRSDGTRRVSVPDSDEKVEWGKVYMQEVAAQCIVFVMCETEKSKGYLDSNTKGVRWLGQQQVRNTGNKWLTQTPVVPKNE